MNIDAKTNLDDVEIAKIRSAAEITCKVLEATADFDKRLENCTTLYRSIYNTIHLCTSNKQKT